MNSRVISVFQAILSNSKNEYIQHLLFLMEKLEIRIFLKWTNNRSSVREDFENLYLDSSVVKVSFFYFYC